MSAIRHIRQSVFKMTQTAFAEETDIAQSTLSRWELGAEPTLEGVRKIRAAALRRGLGWDEDWFLLLADDGPCRQPDAAMPRARGTQDIPTPSEPVPADGFGCAERGLINPPSSGGPPDSSDQAPLDSSPSATARPIHQTARRRHGPAHGTI